MTFAERYNPDLPVNPYLKLPIEKDLFSITEGFLYSRQERDIHGYYFHGGIDFDAPYGTPVKACAAGYAVASYHRFTATHKDGSMKLYRGKPLGFGFGYMVQIYHPDNLTGIPGGRITQYGHLSFINPKIQFSPKEPVDSDIVPKIEKYYQKHPSKADKVDITEILNQQVTITENFPWARQRYGFIYDTDPLKKESYLLTHNEAELLYRSGNPLVAWVEQGEEIGRVGNSGIIWGKASQSEASQHVNEEILEPLVTWDEPHLHFEEASRNPSTGNKESRRDPFYIYKSARWYNKKHIKRSLFSDYSGR